LARPLYWSAARSPHIVDIQLVRKGLHMQPADLRVHLQALIDAAEDDHLAPREHPYDAVVLAYGLCGQAIAGLNARSKPLVIPRAHDCITLFLGSRQRYQAEFTDNPGTFWYAHDYIERDDGSGATLSMGSGTDTDLDAVYDEYVQKYGRDNADYLMEVMGAWQKHYRRAVFIDVAAGTAIGAGAALGDGAAVEARAQAEAQRRGWSFERVAGDLVLVRRLLQGDWADDFLTVPPGEQVRMAYDDRVICI
jgi:hypothetical protein